MPARKLLSALRVLFLISVLTPVVFGQATGQAGEGQLIETKVSAVSLKNNLLGDPIEQAVVIYLPPSYRTSPAKKYPTLYLLHGFTAGPKAWTSGGYQGMKLQPFMDEMIKSGKSREMIVVAPNGRNFYGGAFYSNSAVNGNCEDYIYQDLVAYVDKTYRTLARAESRGVAGHSMGGYGAVMLGMKHPDVFSAVYALSPCCLGIEGDITEENPAWLKVLRLTSRDQLKLQPQSFDEFFMLAFVASSAAFSPNPAGGPFQVDFPFREKDGRVEKNENGYARWKAKMPLYLVEENKTNLLKLRGLFLDYGQKEEFSHIRISTSLFSKALSESGIPHVFELYERGDHGSLIRQRFETRVVQFFSAKLDFSEPGQ